MGATSNHPSLITVETMVSSTWKIYGTAPNVSLSPYVPLLAMSCKYLLNGCSVHNSSDHPFRPVFFNIKYRTISCCNRSAYLEIPILPSRYAIAGN